LFLAVKYATEAKMPAQPLGLLAETRISLLTRDGAAFLAFRPRLSAPQYVELQTATERAFTRDDLYAAARSLAGEWAIEVQFEE
jgi:hypothetical protein